MLGIVTTAFSIEKVVVVGAGIAGLTAACRLQSMGIDVDLYEARDRVGGRIFTVKIEDRLAELGGQNLSDGGEFVHLKRLIDEFALQTNTHRIYLRHNYFNGSTLKPVQELLNENRIDLENHKGHNLKEILDQLDISQDFYDLLAVRLAAYEGGPVEKLSSIYKETLSHILSGGVCAAHPELYVDLISIVGGNSSLPEKMASKLGDRLHLNMPLKALSKTAEGSYLLTFENGKEVTADLLILAVPCPVFKHIEISEDVIPSQKLEQICNIQYGENAKILVPFDTAAHSTGVIGKEEICFLDPIQQILTVYYTGNRSRYTADSIVNNYAHARSMMELNFGGDCPDFIRPVYAKSQNFSSYEGPVGHSWPNDLYAGGSYSYVASGMEDLLLSTIEENGELYKALFAPIEERLYFTGEHTSILFDVPGTMEAAAESGERIARSIISNRAGCGKDRR